MTADPADQLQALTYLEAAARSLRRAYRDSGPSAVSAPAAQAGRVLTDPAEIDREWLALHRDARHELSALGGPPRPDVAPVPRSVHEARATMVAERAAAGVRFRTVRAVVDMTGDADVPPPVDGDDLRTLAVLPLALTVADRRSAMVSVRTAGGAAGVLVLDSAAPDYAGVCDALAHLAELVWSLAVPVRPGDGADPLDRVERGIVSLMAVGATEDVVARRLGISRRTVVRRVAELNARLGASSRFQAGVQAARRGWL